MFGRIWNARLYTLLTVLSDLKSAEGKSDHGVSKLCEARRDAGKCNFFLHNAYKGFTLYSLGVACLQYASRI